MESSEIDRKRSKPAFDDENPEGEDGTKRTEDTFIKDGVKNQLVLVRGPLFDLCSSTITIVISFAVVINYLIISDRVQLKNVPFVSQQHIEPSYALDHQRVFTFPNAEISSHFDSGNARSITQNAPYEFEIKVGGDPHGASRRWYYF